MEASIHELSTRGDELVVRFSGCDYKCRYCNVPHLVEFRTEEVMPLKEACAAIDATGKQIVVFSGGEPLLQRQALLALLRHCRERKLRTVLDTNASKPEAMRTLLDEGLVDEFRVDAKAPLPGFDRVTRAATFFKPAEELFSEFKKSLRLLKARPASVALSFSTPIIPGLLYKKGDVLELAILLDGLGAKWSLVPFEPAITLDPALEGVSPPTPKFLDTLVGFVKKEFPQLDVKAGA